jgi:hypothetical protein
MAVLAKALGSTEPCGCPRCRRLRQLLARPESIFSQFVRIQENWKTLPPGNQTKGVNHYTVIASMLAGSDYMHVWFVTSIATLCLIFLSKINYLIRTTNLRQSVAHLLKGNGSCTIVNRGKIVSPYF